MDSNSTHNTNNQTAPKILALFSCMSIFLIIISFASGIAGSYLGSRIFTTENQQPTNFSGTNVSIDEDSAVIDVVKQNQDAVVSIVITRELTEYQKNLRERFGGSTEGTQTLGEGSGFIISADGLVVTNRHVVSDEEADYTVLFSDGTETKAEVLARDTVLDIAIIKIDPEDRDLSVVTTGTSAGLEVGQRVVAIGNSLGQFSGTVSYGIVSGLSRSIIASDTNGSNAERLEGVIQTDASINPGNSGGPLFDIQGNVIGVNVAVAQNAENIGFAIPIDTVQRIINDVLEFGEIRRPYLGVRFQTVTPIIQDELNLKEDFGALIVSSEGQDDAIVEGSPADKAGLQEGDHILRIDSEPISIENPLQTVIQNKQVGDEVEVEFLRDGKVQNIVVTLELSEL